MLENKYIIENLEKTNCPKCGASLGKAKFVTLSEAPIAWVAHTVCPLCKTESMITITPTGSGIMPIQSDLIGSEHEKFINASTVTYDELLDLHVALKKKSIWNLLQKKEKNLEKIHKA